jgi:hypothetical protein
VLGELAHTGHWPPYMNYDDHRTTAGNKPVEQPFVRTTSGLFLKAHFQFED